MFYRILLVAVLGCFVSCQSGSQSDESSVQYSSPFIDSLEERDALPISDEYDVGIFWAVSSTGLRLHNGGSIGVYAFTYFNPETESGSFGFCNLPDGSFGKIGDVVY